MIVAENKYKVILQEVGLNSREENRSTDTMREPTQKVQVLNKAIQEIEDSETAGEESLSKRKPGKNKVYKKDKNFMITNAQQGEGKNSPERHIIFLRFHPTKLPEIKNQLTSNDQEAE
jgi:hypothetical protein